MKCRHTGLLDISDARKEEVNKLNMSTLTLIICLKKEIKKFNKSNRYDLTTHVVVPSAWSPSPSPSSESLVSSSSSSTVEMTTSVWSPTHIVISPVVSIVPTSALRSRWRAHHAWTSAAEWGSVPMWRGRGTEMRSTRWLVWRVTAVHGHLHVHVVVHVHAGTMAKQTWVHYKQETTIQILSL